MELMIDTNVLLDIMLKRDRYTESVRSDNCFGFFRAVLKVYKKKMRKLIQAGLPN